MVELALSPQERADLPVWYSSLLDLSPSMPRPRGNGGSRRPRARSSLRSRTPLSPYCTDIDLSPIIAKVSASAASHFAKYRN